MYDVNPLSLKLHLADIDRQFAGTGRPPTRFGRFTGVLSLLRSLPLRASVPPAVGAVKADENDHAPPSARRPAGLEAARGAG